MVRTGKADQDCLLDSAMSWASIVVAGVNSMPVVEAATDRISFDNLIAHLANCWSGSVEMKYLSNVKRGIVETRYSMSYIVELCYLRKWPAL